jgi:hypothetical protein
MSDLQKTQRAAGGDPKAKREEQNTAKRTPTGPAWQLGCTEPLILAVERWRAANPRDALPAWLQRWLGRCWRTA